MFCLYYIPICNCTANYYLQVKQNITISVSARLDNIWRKYFSLISYNYFFIFSLSLRMHEATLNFRVGFLRTLYYTICNIFLYIVFPLSPDERVIPKNTADDICSTVLPLDNYYYYFCFLVLTTFSSVSKIPFPGVFFASCQRNPGRGVYLFRIWNPQAVL